MRTMGQSDNIYDQIRELLGEFHGGLAVLEQQIDIDVQMEYYDCNQSITNEKEPIDILQAQELLFLHDTATAIKKQLLARLANIATIESYRLIEKFVRKGDKDLHDWAVLALQENKLLLESSLLDENKILISTGLGGKGLKLRYFTVLTTLTGRHFSDFERKLVKNELYAILGKCQAEPETIHFDRELCRIVSVIPLKVPIQKLFDNLIVDCNVFGDFLNPDFLITNVRILSGRQIRAMMKLG